jgi:hypothetical protein
LDEEGRNIEARRAGTNAGFFEKDEEKTNFEEEGIPLEGEEILADIYEREPAEPREDGGEGSKQAGGEGEGTSDSKQSDEAKGEIGGAEEPSEGGK